MYPSQRHRDFLMARLFLFERPIWRLEARIHPKLPLPKAAVTIFADETCAFIFEMEKQGMLWEPRDVQDLELIA